jgi:hypothetical protein
MVRTCAVAMSRAARSTGYGIELSEFAEDGEPLLHYAARQTFRFRTKWQCIDSHFFIFAMFAPTQILTSFRQCTDVIVERRKRKGLRDLQHSDPETGGNAFFFLNPSRVSRARY